MALRVQPGATVMSRSSHEEGGSACFERSVACGRLTGLAARAMRRDGGSRGTERSPEGQSRTFVMTGVAARIGTLAGFAFGQIIDRDRER